MFRLMLSSFTAVVAWVGGLQAQDASLPASLSGRWTFVGPAGVFTDTVSIRFDGPQAPGPVAGKITAGGVTCGNRDEPFSGTWDGSVLKFDVKVYADVNTTRRGADCSALAQYVVTRKPGQTAFEGEIRRGPTTAQVKLAP